MSLSIFLAMNWTSHPSAQGCLKKIQELWNTSYNHEPEPDAFQRFLAVSGYSSINVPENCPVDHEEFRRGRQLAREITEMLLENQRSEPSPAKENEMAKTGKRVRRQPPQMNKTEPRRTKRQKPEEDCSESQLAMKRYEEMYASTDFKEPVYFPARLTYSKDGQIKLSKQQLSVFWRMFFLKDVKDIEPPPEDYDRKQMKEFVKIRLRRWFQKFKDGHPSEDMVLAGYNRSESIPKLVRLWRIQNDGRPNLRPRKWSDLLSTVEGQPPYENETVTKQRDFANEMRYVMFMKTYEIALDRGLSNETAAEAGARAARWVLEDEQCASRAKYNLKRDGDWAQDLTKFATLFADEAGGAGDTAPGAPGGGAGGQEAGVPVAPEMAAAIPPPAVSYGHASLLRVCCVCVSIFHAGPPCYLNPQLSHRRVSTGAGGAPGGCPRRRRERRRLLWRQCQR